MRTNLAACLLFILPIESFSLLHVAYSKSSTCFSGIYGQTQTKLFISDENPADNQNENEFAEEDKNPVKKMFSKLYDYMFFYGLPDDGEELEVVNRKLTDNKKLVKKLRRRLPSNPFLTRSEQLAILLTEELDRDGRKDVKKDVLKSVVTKISNTSDKGAIKELEKDIENLNQQVKVLNITLNVTENPDEIYKLSKQKENLTKLLNKKKVDLITILQDDVDD